MPEVVLRAPVPDREAEDLERLLFSSEYDDAPEETEAQIAEAAARLAEAAEDAKPEAPQAGEGETEAVAEEAPQESGDSPSVENPDPYADRLGIDYKPEHSQIERERRSFAASLYVQTPPADDKGFRMDAAQTLPPLRQEALAALRLRDPSGPVLRLERLSVPTRLDMEPGGADPAGMIPASPTGTVFPALDSPQGRSSMRSVMDRGFAEAEPSRQPESALPPRSPEAGFSARSAGGAARTAAEAMEPKQPGKKRMEHAQPQQAQPEASFADPQEGKRQGAWKPRKKIVSKREPPKKASRREKLRQALSMEAPRRREPPKETQPKQSVRQALSMDDAPKRDAPKETQPKQSVRQALSMDDAPKRDAPKETQPKQSVRQTLSMEAPPKRDAPKETQPKQSVRQTLSMDDAPKRDAPKEPPQKQNTRQALSMEAPPKREPPREAPPKQSVKQSLSREAPPKREPSGTAARRRSEPRRFSFPQQEKQTAGNGMLMTRTQKSKGSLQMTERSRPARGGGMSLDLDRKKKKER